jgi:peptidoglycan hydrolase-like protein with peptidoglycan-binding domain
VIGLEDRKKHYAHALHVLGNGGGHAVAESHASAAGGADMNTVIRRGSRGETVAAVQAKLGLNADGDFGPGTEQALKNWQAANGLTADGIAGPATLARLLG